MREPSTTAEEWRPVVGWPEYEVSDSGSVRSVSRTIVGKDGRVIPKPGRPLSTSVRDGGYLVVHFRVRASGRKSMPFVHRLVLDAFVGQCPDGMECRHKDGNAANNRLDNLVWGTPLENARDRDEHGTHARGEGHPNHKLTESDIQIIRSERRAGVSTHVLAARYGVHHVTIGKIVARRLWAHVE